MYQPGMASPSPILKDAPSKTSIGASSPAIKTLILALTIVFMSAVGPVPGRIRYTDNKSHIKSKLNFIIPESLDLGP